MLWKRNIYYGWVIVAVSFTTMALSGPVGTEFRLFYQAFKDEFGWSHTSISGIFGLHQLLNGALSPLIGWLIDRYGPRRVMPLGAIILASGLGASSQVTALWQLYITFGVVAALGVSMLQAVPNIAVVSNWFIRSRGTAVGIVLAGAGLGELVLVPSTQWFILNTGWRTTYMVFAPIILIVPVALILLFQYHRPEDKGLKPYGETEVEKQTAKREVVVIDHDWANTEWTLGRALATYRFWAMIFMTLSFSFGYFLISPQIFVFTQELAAFQASSIIVAFVLGAAGFQEGSAKLFGGIISDRLGREKTITLSIGLIIIGVWSLDLLRGYPSFWLLYIAVFFYGMGYGLSLPSIMASLADLFQGPRFGAILGGLTLGGLFGAAFGASLGGYLRDLTGGYRVSFIIATIAFAAAVTLIWSARPGRVRIVRKVSAASGAL